MTLDRKKIIWCIAVVVILAIAIYYFFFRKKKPESSYVFEKIPTPPLTEKGELEPNALPDFFNLQYKIASQGKKSVFPIVLEKVTQGPIELPNRRSLLNRDIKYKFTDIMPGDKIKAVSIQRLSYTAGANAFSDDFLITDKDYVIAYSQAQEHFRVV